MDRMVLLLAAVEDGKSAEMADAIVALNDRRAAHYAALYEAARSAMEAALAAKQPPKMVREAALAVAEAVRGGPSAEVERLFHRVVTWPAWGRAPMTEIHKAVFAGRHLRHATGMQADAGELASELRAGRVTRWTPWGWVHLDKWTTCMVGLPAEGGHHTDAALVALVSGASLTLAAESIAADTAGTRPAR